MSNKKTTGRTIILILIGVYAVFRLTTRTGTFDGSSWSIIGIIIPVLLLGYVIYEFAKPKNKDEGDNTDL